jgi:anti-sigma B factor antagonist
MSLRQHQRPASPRPVVRLAGARGRARRAGRRFAADLVAPSFRLAGAAWPTLVVRLPAQLDESNAAAVKASLLAAAGRRPHLLVADMSGTRWCDWAGAGALASAFTGALAGGTELRLVATDACVRRVLSVNGLDRMMSVCPDVSAASTAPPGGRLPG